MKRYEHRRWERVWTFDPLRIDWWIERDLGHRLTHAHHTSDSDSTFGARKRVNLLLPVSHAEPRYNDRLAGDAA